MIKLKGITKRYGDNFIYKDFNLEIEENKTLVILGESGVGKTTLLNVLAGLIEFSGEVIGKPEKISFVFQKDRLIPNLTVEENINLVAKEEDVCSIIKDMGLFGKEKLYPKSLSAGMARRVAIARALAYKSTLLLMDEPFINLDVALKYSLINSLKDSLTKNPRTCVLVTHDIYEAVSVADRIIVLSEKGIVYDNSSINEKTEKELFGIMIND